jgi:hypothetical protein
MRRIVILYGGVKSASFCMENPSIEGKELRRKVEANMKERQTFENKRIRRE